MTKNRAGQVVNRYLTVLVGKYKQRFDWLGIQPVTTPFCGADRTCPPSSKFWISEANTIEKRKPARQIDSCLPATPLGLLENGQRWTRHAVPPGQTPQHQMIGGWQR
jgi:hypothetical protein